MIDATHRWSEKRLACLAFGATIAASSVAHAQRPVAPGIDRRLQPQPSEGTSPEDGSPWRGSTLTWNNSATTATLGVGDDVQSENPTYEMSFALSPRYYLWESDGELSRSFAVGARIETIREFTNSETTTDRGEWLLSNLLVAPQYSHALYDRGGYETAFSLRAPAVALPTSKAARNNGTIFGLGARVMALQNFPLLGENSKLFPSFGLTGFAGYDHAFRRATTPTNPELERERMGLDGETVPSDQLTGRAFTDDEVVLGFSTTLVLHERVRWSNLFEWHLAWRYRFREDAEVALATGPAPVEHQEDPDNFGVVTLFASEIGVAIVPECSLEFGYQNLASQLGPDAERRSPFYSPEARFSLSLVGHLDAIHGRVAGTERASVARGERVSGDSH